MLRSSVAGESACHAVNLETHVGQALSPATELNGAMPARTCTALCLLFVLASGTILAQSIPRVADEPPGGLRAGPPVLSPPAQTSANFKGKKIIIKYSAPSRRKRVIFGGLEPYGKVWRAGANDATLIHTDADLDLNGLPVPHGDYTLFVWLDATQWQLIINKQTGQTGLEYDARQDLGRVPMEMSKPPKTIERYRMNLTRVSDSEGQLELAWENTVATVRFHLK